MRCHLERDFATLDWNVYFFEATSRDTRVLVLRGDSVEVVDVPHGGKMPVSLKLPVEAMEALLVETEQVIPVSHATERHLKDSIAVRDRLLAMVERAELVQVDLTPSTMTPTNGPTP